MAEAFVELGAEAVTHLTNNHFETAYDKVRDRFSGSNSRQQQQQQPSDYANRSTTSTSAQSRRRQKNQLPSPERDQFVQTTRSVRRNDSLERESETSERVLRAYENEPDDPRRKVESVLSVRTNRDRDRRDSANKMSTYLQPDRDGYAASQRPRSQPPRSRYDDDGDSDYDDREGRRYKSNGRGYDDRDDGYDREIIETERYRGVSSQALVPARPYDARKTDSYTSRDPYGPAGAGAVAPYRRSQGDLTETRSRRGRHDRDDYDSRYDSRSRSRSREGRLERDGDRVKNDLEKYFDTSTQGLGVGIAGAVVGGLAGRQFGNEHKRRDIIIGALVGGLGANAAEAKYRDWKEEKKEKLERREERWEDKWDGRDQRARSSIR
ncbi:pre-mRNA-splicing factor 38B-like protein [Acrodontium crateriforme]|uniref:Pre-mRNA-splicing factor 38B-like protein n=1 Tax=Acrodontium crateriforme TaxID=150365 RepID=A0AAQ3M4B4_9PEZI|nr:pre-mRNA-splicing factor 38B-like protein [Acrodontium crateriforme]